MSNPHDMSRAVNLLQALVRINTCQPAGNESVVVDFLESQFAPFEDVVWKQRIDHGANRSSLLLRIGPDVPGGLAIIGHLDTVTVGNIDDWKHDPFSGDIIDGTVYGRGSVDMKGGVAIMTDLALALLESRSELKKPLYLVYTADEEKGLTGVRAIVEAQTLSEIDALIIAEPTNNKIAIAEKGALWFRFVVHGRLAHGSKPDEGINAVEIAIKIAQYVQEVVASDVEPHALLGPATASINRLSGGIMTNVIPALAEVEVDCRTLPSQDNAKIRKAVEAFVEQLMADTPGLRVETELINDHPAIGADAEDPFILSVQEAVRENGYSDAPCGMTYYTDGGFLVPKINVPFVIMGPGDESLTHQVNEAMDVDSFLAGRQIFEDVITDYVM